MHSKPGAAILDATCGSRMIWFDKECKDAIFMDNRKLDDILCDGRVLNIHPDIVADFRYMPFENGRFSLVVFDPPHLIQAGTNSWLAKKYGVLSDDWRADIKAGFSECMRVLKNCGVLIFKWSEAQISVGDVIGVVGRPLFGTRIGGGKTIWLVFMKIPEDGGER